jgi:hypothetical protein
MEFTMDNGKITPGSDFGILFGFTKELFDGYLWKLDDKIMISVIKSLQPNSGNLTKLINSIRLQGFNVSVPNPTPYLKEILIRKGFIMHMEFDENGPFGDVEVWDMPVIILRNLQVSK